MTYLLPCSECDRDVEIETTDAGRTVNCECGAALQVGTMRDIRSLAQATASADDDVGGTGQSNRRRWSGTQGSVFALGVLIFFAAIAYYGSQYMAINKLDLTDRTAMDKALGDRTIDSMTPFGAYEAWKMLMQLGIGEQEKPEYLLNLEAAESHRVRARYALVLAVIGMLVMISAATLLKPGR